MLVNENLSIYPGIGNLYERFVDDLIGVGVKGESQEVSFLVRAQW